MTMRVAMWASSWGTPCGIAEYTRYLAGELSGVTVAATPSGLGDTDVVHIQHEDWLFDDEGLLPVLSGMASSDVAVVVTEHSPAATPRSWDDLVHVRVAMSEAALALQRDRSPHVPAVLIPHGCPTWFPPRKARRGRTIAAFGFLEEYKGFFKLLDVVQSVPDTDLLLFSFAKHADVEARWFERARGLPVRRVPSFQSVEEIARRIAAEADVVAFWYDPVSTPSVSGAVRVALASGVPVLASPTAWFSELRDVTYQPCDLIDGVGELLGNDALRRTLTANAREYCAANSWRNVAGMHAALWMNLAGRRSSGRPPISPASSPA